MSKLTKHIATFYLAVFYLILSIGVKVDLHYCLGDIKDFKLFSFAEAKESCCKDAFCAIDRDFSCCDSKAFFYHLEEDQLNSGFDTPSKFINNLACLFQHPTIHFPDLALAQRPKSDIPPGIKSSTTPAYLLNCSFVFYG